MGFWVDFVDLSVFLPKEVNFAGSSVPPAPGVQGLYNFCIWGDDFLQIWSLLAASTFLGVTGVVFSVDFVDFSGVLPNEFKFAGSSVPPAPGVQGLCNFFVWVGDWGLITHAQYLYSIVGLHAPGSQAISESYMSGYPCSMIQ